MSVSAASVISREEELALHRRLMDRDPTAPADLATMFLDQLISWLLEHNRSSIPEEMCIEAATDAWEALVKSPASFNPDRRKRLGAYLRMSAQGDLKNILQREMRHRQNRMSLEDVELSAQGGKYLAKEDDPSLPLQIREESGKAVVQVVMPARDGLTDAEAQALDLLLQGEKKTHVFALALGIGHLPKKAKQQEVKRVKDKLKKRMQRGIGGNGKPS
jgi:hypothetical protein